MAELDPKQVFKVSTANTNKLTCKESSATVVPSFKSHSHNFESPPKPIRSDEVHASSTNRLAV